MDFEIEDDGDDYNYDWNDNKKASTIKKKSTSYFGNSTSNDNDEDVYQYSFENQQTKSSSSRNSYDSFTKIDSKPILTDKLNTISQSQNNTVDAMDRAKQMLDKYSNKNFVKSNQTNNKPSRLKTFNEDAISLSSNDDDDFQEDSSDTSTNNFKSKTSLKKKKTLSRNNINDLGSKALVTVSMMDEDENYNTLMKKDIKIDENKFKLIKERQISDHTEFTKYTVGMDTEDDDDDVLVNNNQEEDDDGYSNSMNEYSEDKFDQHEDTDINNQMIDEINNSTRSYPSEVMDEDMRHDTTIGFDNNMSYSRIAYGVEDDIDSEDVEDEVNDTTQSSKPKIMSFADFDIPTWESNPETTNVSDSIGADDINQSKGADNISHSIINGAIETNKVSHNTSVIQAFEVDAKKVNLLPKRSETPPKNNKTHSNNNTINSHVVPKEINDNNLVHQAPISNQSQPYSSIPIVFNDPPNYNNISYNQQQHQHSIPQLVQPNSNANAPNYQYPNPLDEPNFTNNQLQISASINPNMFLPPNQQPPPASNPNIGSSQPTPPPYYPHPNYYYPNTLPYPMYPYYYSPPPASLPPIFLPPQSQAQHLVQQQQAMYGNMFNPSQSLPNGFHFQQLQQPLSQYTDPRLLSASYDPYTGYTNTAYSAPIVPNNGTFARNSSSLANQSSNTNIIQQPPLVLNLLQELQQAKEEADWMKLKLAETLIKLNERQVIDENKDINRYHNDLNKIKVSPSKGKVSINDNVTSPMKSIQSPVLPLKSSLRTTNSNNNTYQHSTRGIAAAATTASRATMLEDSSTLLSDTASASEGNITGGGATCNIEIDVDDMDDTSIAHDEYEYSSDFESINKSMNIPATTTIYPVNRTSPNQHISTNTTNVTTSKYIETSSSDDIPNVIPSKDDKFLKHYTSSISDRLKDREKVMNPLQESLAHSLLNSQELFKSQLESLRMRIEMTNSYTNTMNMRMNDQWDDIKNKFHIKNNPDYISSNNHKSTIDPTMYLSSTYEPKPTLKDIKAEFNVKRIQNTEKLLDLLMQIYPSMSKEEAYKLAMKI